MEEYQKHVRQTHVERQDFAWCGAVIGKSTWAFTSSDHLLNSIVGEGRLQGCPACVKAIEKILNQN